LGQQAVLVAPTRRAAKEPHRKETIMDMTYPVENRKPWGASLTLSSIIIALYLIFSAYQAIM